MPDKRYLSVEEVAKHFGVTPTTVYRLAQKGLLPGFKVGFQWRFSQEMLESWVADQVTVEWFKAEKQKIGKGPKPSGPKRKRSSDELD